MFGGLGGTLPIRATDYAGRWDTLYEFLFGVCVFFFFVVIIPMVIFCFKYKARPGVRADQKHTHNTALEFLWTSIPTVIVIVIFVWGWVLYKDLLEPPVNSMEVRVIAKSWNWTFQYDDGRLSPGELVVPVNTPVKLLITSEKKDVLHSFFVPNFRIKKDAVPGMFTMTWFKADKIGQHLVFCTEYCGADHSNMMAKVIVVSPEDFQKWRWGGKIENPPPVGLPFPERGEAKSASSTIQVQTALAKQGEKLVAGLGCTSCHAADGASKVGPTYRGLYGRERLLADGSRVIADDNYIREKIEFPTKRTLQGYVGGVMPSYAGQLDEPQLNAVIAYIKELK